MLSASCGLFSQGVGKVNFSASGLVLAAALAGCGGGSKEAAPSAELAPSIVQPGAPGEATRTLSAEELAAVESTPHTSEDVAFMRGMIHHHAQALRLTALVPKHTENRQIRLLARRIDVSQEAEIELMRGWLEERGEPAPELHREHGHAHGDGQALMPGMLTEPELKQLEAAKDAAFDRRFLRSMIRHHRGAVTMVNDLYAGGGGAESAVDGFARHVDSDQGIEIARMELLLAR